MTERPYPGWGWEIEPPDCECNGPWMVDGVFCHANDPLLPVRPRWPYNTRYRVYHRLLSTRRRSRGRLRDVGSPEHFYWTERHRELRQRPGVTEDEQVG
jgi:hypothetical protein